MYYVFFFFFSSRRRHTRWTGDWSSDVCSSDLVRSVRAGALARPPRGRAWSWDGRQGLDWPGWIIRPSAVGRVGGRGLAAGCSPRAAAGLDPAPTHPGAALGLSLAPVGIHWSCVEYDILPPRDAVAPSGPAIWVPRCEHCRSIV